MAKRVKHLRKARCVAVLAAMALVGCGRTQETPTDAIEYDAVLGDQCFYVVTERPSDCYARAPCTWFDASLKIGRSAAGDYELRATPGGWAAGTRRTARKRPQT